MTIRDLIKSSLRLIGAIAAGETPSSAEETDALTALNSMIEGWSNNGLLIFQNQRKPFMLSPPQASYTIGPSGDFDTERPMIITQASIVENNNELGIDILNEQEWRDIGVKTTTSTLPAKLYIEDSYPLKTLYFWPVPSVANQVVLYGLDPLTTYLNVSDDISLPPGYARALRYNLAVELAPEYGKTPSDLVVMAAAESKADVMRTNYKPAYMDSDTYWVHEGKPFNYLTGR